MTDINSYKKLIRAIKRIGPIAENSNDTEAINIVIRMFNAMPVEDRFKILKKAIEHPSLVPQKRSAPSQVQDNQEQKTADTLLNSDNSVSDFNQKELIKLKMFFLRFAVRVAVISVGLFAVLYFIIGTTTIHSGNSFINEAITIFQYLFN